MKIGSIVESVDDSNWKIAHDDNINPAKGVNSDISKKEKVSIMLTFFKNESYLVTSKKLVYSMPSGDKREVEL